MAKKVKKFPPTEDPKSGGTSGSAAKLKRDKKGELKAELKKDFGGVTKKTIREDRAVAAKSGDRTFSGTPAPRVGGKQKVIAKSGPLKSATKKVIRQSRRKPTGSPQARRSQRNNRF